MAKTPSPKEKKSPELPALEVYQQNDCTLAAFKQALQHGLQYKEKELAKTFKKQCFQAAGLDQYRLHCQDETELQAVLNLSLALVDKNENPNEWLEILEQPDYWNAARLTAISHLLNKAVTRLATHIPKARNPANEGAPRFNKRPCQDESAVSAGEASLAIATVEGDATLVGARFFFEFVFYLENKPSSVIALLLNKDDKLTNFLQHIGLDDATINRWQSVVRQSPGQLSPLQAQLLLTDEHNNWLSVTPMFSVAGSSWLGQWRREVFTETNGDENSAYDAQGFASVAAGRKPIATEGTRPLYTIESAEYGGTNARNVAAILMDFSGKQQHPKILAPPVKRDTKARLERLIHRPGVLINPKPLRGKILAALSNSYNELPNQQRTQKLSGLIENLLEDCLEDIIHIRSLLDGESDEARAFQDLFNAIATTDPYLLFAQGMADEEQLKIIGSDITQKWLGPFDKFEAEEGGERYNKIKQLVIEQLHAYRVMEATL